MNLKPNKYYILRLLIAGKIITYRCFITTVTDDEVAFTDNKNARLTYRTNFIIGYEEISEAEFNNRFSPNYKR